MSLQNIALASEVLPGRDFTYNRHMSKPFQWQKYYNTRNFSVLWLLAPTVMPNSKELFIIAGFFVYFWSRNLKICLLFWSYNGSGRSMFTQAFGLRDCWCAVWKAILSFAVIILFSSFKYFLTKIFIKITWFITNWKNYTFFMLSCWYKLIYIWHSMISEIEWIITNVKRASKDIFLSV